ncbi:hypothetical protein [Sunxiuqinia indica]|uniref:hypothetical protein n=1 Tax=Sunxiuqinia indica TaxID=2692584 RepID=UPI00135AE2E7|nr:hypothetical protein [Sunxiuqinia indica]
MQFCDLYHTANFNTVSLETTASFPSSPLRSNEGEPGLRRMLAASFNSVVANDKQLTPRFRFAQTRGRPGQFDTAFHSPDLKN